MNAFGFAWRSLVRQPARALLGTLGVAAVGALLFDMLLLSNGLVLSMRDLLDRAGFDLRVTASEALPGQGPRVPAAMAAVTAIEQLAPVRSVVAVRFADALVQTTSHPHIRAGFQGIGGRGVRPWTILRGRDVTGTRDLLVNGNTARELALEPGASVQMRASCQGALDAQPPVTFTVTGIASFPFDNADGHTVAASMSALADACGAYEADQADVIMVASREDSSSQQTKLAVMQAVPELRVFTSEDMVGRFERGGFTYFRQISTVLTTVTLTFAVLLITVLLTVSVNQRLGEIAALRALGFSRGRVVADVLCESALIVGIGGLTSLPLGLLLAYILDTILKDIPGIPADMHFFVFQRSALVVHISLLALTALVAALYPMRIVSRLPIAATLRIEGGT